MLGLSYHSGRSIGGWWWEGIESCHFPQRCSPSQARLCELGAVDQGNDFIELIIDDLGCNI